MEITAKGRRSIAAFAIAAAVFSALNFKSGVAAQPGATITLDPSTVYQTMRGWEATATAFRFTSQAFMQQVVDAGINRVRLEIKAGAENTTDYYGAWQATLGGVETSDPIAGSSAAADAFIANMYRTVNDNSNANAINAAGFHFTQQDDAVRRTVDPMRAKLEARGERLYVNLCYVSFNPTNAIPIHQDPAEYAELILATFQHLQTTYGWVPDGVELMLEPDNRPEWWNGTSMAQRLLATQAKLAAAGYHPDFIGPSTTNTHNAWFFIDDMLKVPGASQYLKELSYHRYGESTPNYVAGVGTRAAALGIGGSMLEWWTTNNTYATLHEDLTLGRSSAYQRGVVQPLNNADFYTYHRHYFSHVRMGARRIGATTTDSAFDPAAFINTDGKYAIVIKATGAGAISIPWLPAGTYGIRYTTATATDVNAATQTISTGGTVSTSIPGAGVLVVFATSASPPTAPPAAFSKSAPSTGATGQATTLTLSWGASAGATSYSYCYDTTNDGACSSWTSAGTSTSASISNLASNTTYYWQVKAANAAGTSFANGNATAFWNVTTQVAAPAPFSKSGPAAGATGRATSLTLNWGATTGATSYAYCYDTTNDGACAAWTSTGTGTSAALGNLTNNTTYYWQVRATNAAGTTYANGGSTAFWSFTTQVAAPAGFAKSGPATGATGQGTSLTLMWGPSTGATSYEYCYDTTNDGACAVWTSTGTVASAAIGNLSYSTTYYWHVRAINAAGTTYANGGASAFWSFATTMAAPAAFTKASPVTNATGAVTATVVTWNASAGATDYEYCFDTTNDNSCATWTSTGNVSSAALSNLAYNTTYYWQVRANNSTGTTYADTGAGNFWQFTTVAVQKAQLTSPAPGSTLTASSVTFQWTGGIGAMAYALYVGTSPAASDVVNQNVGTALSTVVNGLPADGRTLYVRLLSNIAGGWQYNDYTLTASSAGLQKAQLISPAPASTLTSSTATFQWTGGVGPTRYWLYVGTTAGAFDLVNMDAGSALSFVVSNLPADGRTLYVRLHSLMNGAWQYNDYTLTASAAAPQKAQLISPAPGSTLTSSTVALQWTGGTNVARYWIYVGSTQGAFDLVNRDMNTGLSTVASGLPVDGRTVYVRLLSNINGQWDFNDYTLTAATVVPTVTRAELTSPAPGSTLTSATVTFTWTGGTGATQYWLYVGTAAGAFDLVNRDMGTNLSTVASGLPTDGRTLYVRLYSNIAGAWQYNDYVLTSATIVISQKAELTSPAPGSTLTASSVTFQWTGGTGVTQYWLYVGSAAGAFDLLNRDAGTSLSTVASSLPTDGRTLYVRLNSLINGAWQYNDYTVRAVTQTTPQGAQLVTPAPGSTLTSTTVTFTWTGGSGATQYYLYVGSTPGFYDILLRGMGTSLSTVVTGLPSDGRTIYVRLYSQVNGAWQYTDYTFTAFR